MLRVLDPNDSYTFSKCFDFPFSPENILADLGYTFERTDRENLPYTQYELDWLPELAESMRRRLRRVNTTTEQARREALTFPLVDWICDFLDCSINISIRLASAID